MYSTYLRSEVISHQLWSWEICPQGQRCLFIVTGLGVSCIHHSLTGNWVWESGDANENLSPSPPLSSNSGYCLHPRSYKSDGAWERRRIKRRRGREGWRKWSGGGKKEKWVLWPHSPLQGRHGDWVGVRRMRLREMREHNVQSAVCVICTKTNFISGALSPSFSS